LCGNPHLEYHHFDPPWAQAPHNNPEGIIALCADHHDQADTGAFTKEQLITLKKSNHESVESKFHWRRKHTVFVCGGNFAYNCGGMLQVSGIDIVYFEKDEQGFDTLSLNIYDVCLNPIFVMRKNDWIARTDADDIEAPPRTPRLIFKSAKHRVDIQIGFKDREKLTESERQISSDFGIPEDENVVFVSFTGSIPAPYPVLFAERSIVMPNGVVLTGNKMKNCGHGIVVG